MTARVVCFGELLIDFVALERDVSVGQAHRFEKAAGGAPANVAVGLAKLGTPSAFITQLGNDPFGHFLAETLAENQVDTSGIVFTDRARTCLAFVSVKASGERSFAFYRNPSADMLMESTSLNNDLLAAAEIFHFGSISLIDEPVRSTTLAAAEKARQNRALISYDPNLREALWPSLANAKAGILTGWQYANVAKLSEEELFFLTDTTAPSIEETVTLARQLWHDNLALLVITRGADGCVAITQDTHRHVPGFTVEVEDTIGAGDGFVAGLLSGLLPHLSRGQLPDLQTAGWLDDVLQRANAVGALTTTHRGAIPALPTADLLDSFLNERIEHIQQ
jgi:fructokinase